MIEIDLQSTPFKAIVRNEILRGEIVDPSHKLTFPLVEIEAKGIIDFDALENELVERGYFHYTIMAKNFEGRNNGHIREIPKLEFV